MLTSESHPSELEAVSEDGQIAAGEDEDEHTGEAGTCGAGVLPAQQSVEEGVIVCPGQPCSCKMYEFFLTGQGSIVGRGVGRGLARTSKSTELIASGSGFVLDASGHGTFDV